MSVHWGRPKVPAGCQADALDRPISDKGGGLRNGFDNSLLLQSGTRDGIQRC